MTSLNGKGGAEEIWIFDSSDKSFRKINEVSAVTPEFVVDLPYLMALSWSPDGTRLAVNAGREKLEVWSLENGDHKLVANNIAQDTIPSWSPDGARIAYESVTATGDNRTFHVNVLNLQSEQVKTIADGRFPSWSREANQIAFLDIHQEVYFAVADDGSSRKRLVKAGGQAGPFIWSPDSKAALFDDYYDGGVAVMLVDIGRGKKKALTSGELLAVIDWR
jgi:Tol biopolymer transport system component